MIQAIFFDFNGVIIDDEPIQLKVYQEALAAEGVALTEDDYYNSLGMDDQTFVRAAFERAGLALTDETLSALIERKTELHRQMIEDELPLFQGVVTIIKALSTHYQLGLVSMARRVEIDHVLKRARLDHAFAIIVSAEDVHVCKPDPDCYQRALELLNEKRREERKLPLLPKECLVIEDSPPGIQAGRASGMSSLGVTNTVKEETLRASGADVVTANLADWTVDAIHHVFD
ncbi:MAG: beta-phosphoglucomutase [Acidobacteriota bacterium]|jgi:HAD superfamily hydrolase (TIGR01509 family)|nr:beta-phosphoglucomutase [Acidobacteriota bacterium]